MDRAIIHNARCAHVQRTLGFQFRGTVIQMETYGDRCLLRSCHDHRRQKVADFLIDETRVHLQNHRRTQFLCGLEHTHDRFNIIYIEGRHAIAAFFCFGNDLLQIYQHLTPSLAQDQILKRKDLHIGCHVLQRNILGNAGGHNGIHANGGGIENSSGGHFFHDFGHILGH